MSGEGPCPPHPIPIMVDADAPICTELEINLVECSLDCPSCQDGFCNHKDVLRYGIKECANRTPSVADTMIENIYTSSDNKERVLYRKVGGRKPTRVKSNN